MEAAGEDQDLPPLPRDEAVDEWPHEEDRGEHLREKSDPRGEPRRRARAGTRQQEEPEGRRRRRRQIHHVLAREVHDPGERGHQEDGKSNDGKSCLVPRAQEGGRQEKQEQVGRERELRDLAGLAESAIERNGRQREERRHRGRLLEDLPHQCARARFLERAVKAEAHRQVVSVIPGRRNLELPPAPGRAQERQKRGPGNQEGNRPNEAGGSESLHVGAILTFVPMVGVGA